MTLPAVRRRGGFARPIGLGEFVRRFLAGMEAPVLDPDTRALTGFASVDPRVGAPPQDIWRAYKDFLYTAWGQEVVERWREEGREIPRDPGELARIDGFARARIPQRLSHMRLSSFYRYFRNLRTLGWVEPTGVEEGSEVGGSPGARLERRPDGTALVEVPQPRRFFRLTRAGMDEPPDGAWHNPLLTLYPERGPEYYQETARRARARKGKLPLKIKRPVEEAPEVTPPLAPPVIVPRPARPPRRVVVAPPPPPEVEEIEEEVPVEVQERWDALLERIRGWKTPNPANAERLLKSFVEEAGVESTVLDDALDRLTEYREAARGDFESAEEYREAREDLWQEFLDALDEVELEAGQ